MNKRDFPRVHFYDQDFVDIYDRTWAWVHDFWHSTGDGKQGTEGFFIYPEADGNFLNQYETIFSSFSSAEPEFSAGVPSSVSVPLSAAS